MAKRVLAGYHPTGGYGLYVSRPGKAVTGSTSDDLMFWTSHEETGTNFKSAGHLQSVPALDANNNEQVSSESVINSGSTATVTYKNYASTKVMCRGSRLIASGSSGLNLNTYAYSSLANTSATLSNNGTQSQTINSVTFNMISSDSLY